MLLLKIILGKVVFFEMRVWIDEYVGFIVVGDFWLRLNVKEFMEILCEFGIYGILF